MANSEDADAIDAWVYVHITLADFDCDPNVFTEALGVQPTTAVRAGDSFESPAGHDKQRPRSLWRLKVDIPFDTSIREGLGRAAAALESMNLAALDDTPSHDRLLMVHVIPGDRVPTIAIPRDLMRRIADLGFDAEIGFLHSERPTVTAEI